MNSTENVIKNQSYGIPVIFDLDSTGDNGIIERKINFGENMSKFSFITVPEDGLSHVSGYLHLRC